MEITLLLLFTLALFYCIFADYSIIIALLFGFVLFFSYGLIKKHSFSEMLNLTKEGLKKSWKIAVIMGLIGCLAAIWRASGTIAYIVFYASNVCIPSLILLMSFWSCAAVAFLLGTAIGTSATMGIICMTLAASMQISPFLVGGAVLSGCYLGDICSPISSTLLLVTEVTKTSLFTNMKNVIKASFIPFVIASILYLVLGLISNVVAFNPSTGQIFADNFNLSHVTILPIAFMLLLSFFHFEVRRSLSVTVLLAIIIAVFWQGVSIWRIPGILIFGFTPENAELAQVIGGGGLVSMLRIICIIVIVSCFSAFFEGTGFLNKIEKIVQNMSQTANSFPTTLLVALFSSIISCNTTFCIMLTSQLCDANYEDKSALALDLENSAAAISPLIPWSVSCALPLKTIGAPKVSIIFAVYLITVPIYNLIRAKTRKNNKEIEMG
ncbi:MAG: Na+/H+ antiporter NhaC family protein [Synergistaceae bacterium]|nr:Na+/H+ antiporter NhaC family protein [Synergistaceae bacterium]